MIECTSPMNILKAPVQDCLHPLNSIALSESRYELTHAVYAVPASRACTTSTRIARLTLCMCTRPDHMWCWPSQSPLRSGQSCSNLPQFWVVCDRTENLPRAVYVTVNKAKLGQFFFFNALRSFLALWCSITVSSVGHIMLPSYTSNVRGELKRQRLNERFKRGKNYPQ